MTRPRKAKAAATNEGQRNCLAPMNTNDINENGDRRPLSDIFCNTTIEQRTQFNVPLAAVEVQSGEHFGFKQLDTKCFIDEREE
ncbi:hypothetical protein BCR33DRAFT_711904 [Rhizoclosmatium globosum]|uniref:Uncharacterized protein n=1 Tax=Rhizoclosmatium globosum TaxID=329046 RepID=A0A1Y2D0J5_9FUNG|nr:hypothetical protein BCR33DRAFT_711904 [Rhizoclosmatium globosum]|eukprot:ORY52646.1 hypothetical protein BCR33DRAFT_711904 [Rhizoclosmatium globosum]